MSDLYKHLEALSDATRVRLLRLLQREELSVGELTQVLQLPQPTISRHLKRLRTSGWIQRRTSGTAGLVSMDPAALSPHSRALWALVNEQADDLYPEDDRRLEQILNLRAMDSQEFFGRHAGDWDGVRRGLFGEGYLLPTLLSILPPGLEIADLGCGTGATLAALAPAAGQVFGIDREAAMLEVAAAKTSGFDNVTLLQGDLSALPLPDASLDVALCMLVLHHIKAPGDLLREAARALRPGGRLVVLDMVEHDREAYRRSMGHRHLGFSQAALTGLLDGAGLGLSAWRLLPPDPDVLGPSLFVAVASR